MKKSIILTILGLGAATVASYGQGSIAFNTYTAASLAGIYTAYGNGPSTGTGIGSTFTGELLWSTTNPGDAATTAATASAPLSGVWNVGGAFNAAGSGTGTFATGAATPGYITGQNLDIAAAVGQALFFEVVAFNGTGWNVGSTIFWRTGEPFSVYNTRITGRMFAHNTYSTRVLADYLGGGTVCSGPGSNPAVSCLPNTNFADYTAQSDFGNTGRNFFRGPGYFDMDFSLFKDFRVTESGMTFTLGASAYNVLNHANFANPINSATSGLFGQIQNTVTQPNSPYGNFQGAAVSGRVLQVMAKFKF